jgi:nascent polypeptide-associated complex subunit alpha
MTRKEQVKFAEKPQVIPHTEDVDSESEVSSVSSVSCDDHHHDHDHSHEHGEVGHHHSHPQGTALPSRFSKNEKKAKKILTKLGIKPIAGITRVTLVRSKNLIFAIRNPEVYKNPVNNSYIVFGEAKVEDNGLMAQAQAAQRLREKESNSSGNSQEKSGFSLEELSKPQDSEQKEQEQEDDPSVPVDESGLDPKDIQMVMDQCRVSRSKAVRALRENDNDIVNTIMELTS